MAHSQNLLYNFQQVYIFADIKRLKNVFMRDISSLFSLVLPAGLLDYFTITDCQEQSDRIDLYLEEIESDCYDINGNKLLAHGFTEGKTIQDFPLRSKSLYLHLKRRRYYREVLSSVKQLLPYS